MERSIIVDHLVKQFVVYQKKPGLLAGIKGLASPEKKTVNAISDVSFSIHEGELVGFIGPNGAGKTTTLKTLSGILYPTSGFVSVLGFTPWERNTNFLKQISLVMGQKNQLWWDLPAQETFALLSAIYEIPKSTYKKVLYELVELLDVASLLTTQVRRLSLGERMKMELIAALLHQPKVLFLDEPTIGLDIIAQQKVRDFLVDYNRRNSATVLLTSHNMDDLIHVAKRVIVINRGRIIFDGNFSELIASFAKEKLIKIVASKDIDYKKLEKIGKVVKIEVPQIVISVPRNIATVAASEILQSFPIDDLTIEEESIDSIIAQVFKGPSKKIVRKHKRGK